MRLKKCFLCEKIKPLPFSITEVEDGDYLSFELCADCADSYNSERSEKTSEEDEVSIMTVDDFLDLFQQRKPDACENCGMTEADFQEIGRFGCSDCYDYFGYLMKKVVFPYHGDNLHIGKRPKHNVSNAEKLKILKLFYAKALELEDYEKASVIKSEMDRLNH